jgi:phosphoribosyl 1,2-cyclic phosphodiesterase
MESSALVSWGVRLLIDATRDFAMQARWIVDPIDAILLTHAHRDAAGGLGTKLRGYCRAREYEPIPLLAHPAAIDRLHDRLHRLDHVAPRAVRPGESVQLGGLTLNACDVPHGTDEGFPTYAWRIRGAGRTIVYASDVARLTPTLRRFSANADVLVVDGAMYRRARLAHLRIDEDLPRLCAWPVGQIVLTQIGRSAPAHERLVEITADLCPRACPAYDGWVLEF